MSCCVEFGEPGPPVASTISGMVSGGDSFGDPPGPGAQVSTQTVRKIPRKQDRMVNFFLCFFPVQPFHVIFREC